MTCRKLTAKKETFFLNYQSRHTAEFSEYQLTRLNSKECHRLDLGLQSIIFIKVNGGNRCYSIETDFNKLAKRVTPESNFVQLLRLATKVNLSLFSFSMFFDVFWRLILFVYQQ